MKMKLPTEVGKDRFFQAQDGYFWKVTKIGKDQFHLRRNADGREQTGSSDQIQAAIHELKALSSNG